MSNDQTTRCKSFFTIGLIFQIFYIIIYLLFFRYKHDLSGDMITNQVVMASFPMFQDVQAMIFLGFGFLMTFLKKYGFSSVGINFFLSAMLIQHALVVNGISHMIEKKESIIVVKISDLLNAEFAIAAVLISFGAILGKLTPTQYMIMGLVELVIFRVNEYIGRDLLSADDAGDSMYVHAFGAYFGLAVSFISCRGPAYREHSLEGSSYHSDLFAMIGTLLLWIFWPSFNSGGCEGEERLIAIVNTVVSLLASTVAAFLVCMLFKTEQQMKEGAKKKYKHVYGMFDMVCIQNSTLAGGVAIGTAANMNIGIGFAAIIGSLAGTISVIGYKFITPKMNVIIHDTCGVHNLHGMPAVLAGIVGALATFVGKNPNKSSSNILIYGGGMQIVATIVSIILGVIGGFLTGLLIRICNFGALKAIDSFDDKHFWHIPPSDSDLESNQPTDSELLATGEVTGIELAKQEV